MKYNFCHQTMSAKDFLKEEHQSRKYQALMFHIRNLQISVFLLKRETPVIIRKLL